MRPIHSPRKKTVYILCSIPLDIPVDELIGVAHASELVFVFGTSLTFTPETRLVSERMQRYWTNFAKTGDPNGGDLLAWPRLTGPEDVRINFGSDFTIIPDFRGPECAFWQARFDAAFKAP